MRIIQANLNHSRAAQDLLVHQGSELGSGVFVVSEPFSMPETDERWFSSVDGVAGVLCLDASLASRGRRLLARGVGFVVAEVAGRALASCYLSPALSRRAFNDRLKDLKVAIRPWADRVLIGGGF